MALRHFFHWPRRIGSVGIGGAGRKQVELSSGLRHEQEDRESRGKKGGRELMEKRRGTSASLYLGWQMRSGPTPYRTRRAVRANILGSIYESGCTTDIFLHFAICGIFNVLRYHNCIFVRLRYVLPSLSSLNSFCLDHHSHGSVPLAEYQRDSGVARLSATMMDGLPTLIILCTVMGVA